MLGQLGLHWDCFEQPAPEASQAHTWLLTCLTILTYAGRHKLWACSTLHFTHGKCKIISSNSKKRVRLATQDHIAFGFQDTCLLHNQQSRQSISMICLILLVSYKCTADTKMSPWTCIWDSFRAKSTDASRSFSWTQICTELASQKNENANHAVGDFQLSSSPFGSVIRCPSEIPMCMEFIYCLSHG